jgi:hypothetical protein
VPVEKTSSLKGGKRWLALGIAAVAMLAVLIPTQVADSATKKKKNGIIFNVQSSQGIAGRITYLKFYAGEGKNFAQLELEVIRNCVGDFGSFTERGLVLLTGHTSGNSFFADFHPQNTATDQFRQTASVRFSPGGRKGGLPRWRKATGTVRSTRSIHDFFTNVDCDSGPVSLVTTSSRRATFGPRPPIIVVI